MIAQSDFAAVGVMSLADFTDAELTAIKKCLEKAGGVRIYTPDGLQKDLEEFEKQIGGISACNAVPSELVLKIKSLTCTQRYDLLREIIQWDEVSF